MSTGGARADERSAIRVLLVDDHKVVRRGLRSFLEMVADIEVVAEAANGHHALVSIADLVEMGRAPDVVLMDLVMPGMDGIEATAAILARWPGMRIIAMTSFSETSRVQRALRAGASGYVLKDADAGEVAGAIRAAIRGEVHLDAAVARDVSRALREPRPFGMEALTDRERDVLALIGCGLSNREIAARLTLSERTARTHVSNILRKLELESRTQAALAAVHHGLTDALN
jgi:DNA-binding NarL/FixJ family response regulator